MYNKIARKNPDSLSKKDDEDLELKKIKDDCNALIKEIENTAKIVKSCTIQDKLRVKAIHSNKDKIKEELNDKYGLLFKKLQRDYEIEWLSLLRMFMQQELKIYKGVGQKVENYVLTSKPL